MRKLLTLPAGRVAKWIVFAVWIVVLGVGAPLGAKFEDAQSNESATFLPDGTDSLTVLELSKQFPSGVQVPAVIAFERPEGLTDEDRAAIAGVADAIAADLPEGASAPPPPVYAPNGQGALVTVPLVVGGDTDLLIDATDSFRAQLTGLPDGLDAKLGGPAGFSSDAAGVFGDINGTLLIATASLVFVLLILIYRSPIFWFIPLASVFAAEGAVRTLGYLLTQAGVTVNGQSAGILLVLVFGAGTDYALLLVARYREELHHHEDRHEALRVALTQAGPAILASAGTVILGLLCLALAQVNGTQGLGLIGAIGVAVAAIAMLTLLPALLVIFGRWAFWPFIPRVEPEGAPAATRGVFRRTGERIARGPRRVWIGVTAVLVVLCVGVAWYDDGLTSSNGFRGEVESVQASEIIGRSFPGGESAPTVIVVRDAARAEEAREIVRSSPLVASVGEPQSGPPGVKFTAILNAEPYSEEGYAAIPELRAALDDALGTGVALVGGDSATERDLREASRRDSLLLPPIVLVVVFLVLVALLRSVVAPLLLVGTVILSYFAALGVSLVVFDVIFGFPGVDPSFPLFAFIFLVALGVDYNIFLMARAREEAIRHGTHEGMLRALAATGSVITSAGIVLAGTFAVLGVLPLVALTQIGFVVAFGVLLDTLIVRSILVPALVLDLDRRTWWPSALANAPAGGTGAGQGAVR